MNFKNYCTAKSPQLRELCARRKLRIGARETGERRLFLRVILDKTCTKEKP